MLLFAFYYLYIPLSSRNFVVVFTVSAIRWPIESFPQIQGRN
jgi:hypothetical protein